MHVCMLKKEHAEVTAEASLIISDGSFGRVMMRPSVGDFFSPKVLSYKCVSMKLLRCGKLHSIFFVDAIECCLLFELRIG